MMHVTDGLNYWVLDFGPSSGILKTREHNRRHNASVTYPENVAETTLAKQANL
jgi:hypothetical protein